jgi:hypothetical protein
MTAGKIESALTEAATGDGTLFSLGRVFRIVLGRPRELDRA